MLYAIRILGLHVIVSVFVFITSSLIALIWYEILRQPDDIEDEFTQSETLQLLQIIIGFTYISVIRSFFDTLQQKTALVASMIVAYDYDHRPPADFIQYMTGHSTRSSTVAVKNKQASWRYWSRKNVDDSWKPIFERVVLMERTDHGQLFSLLGPWTALAIFYIFHPPVAYREDGNPLVWALIYSISITVLFSFLGTMWMVERYIPCRRALSPKNVDYRTFLFYSCTIQSQMELSTHYMIADDAESSANRYILHW